MAQQAGKGALDDMSLFSVVIGTGGMIKHGDQGIGSGGPSYQQGGHPELAGSVDIICFGRCEAAIAPSLSARRGGSKAQQEHLGIHCRERGQGVHE